MITNLHEVMNEELRAKLILLETHINNGDGFSASILKASIENTYNVKLVRGK